MKQPIVVVTVTGGIAELHRNELEPEDVLILDFDKLDEYAPEEDKEKADRLLDAKRFNELSEFLADFEERWELP